MIHYRGDAAAGTIDSYRGIASQVIWAMHNIGAFRCAINTGVVQGPHRFSCPGSDSPYCCLTIVGG